MNNTPNSLTKGIITPLVTPFTSKNELDLPAWRQLVTTQLQAGINMLCVAGTTGESSALTVNEITTLVQEAKDIVKNNAHIMVGVSGAFTRQLCNHISILEIHAGDFFDSLLVLAPYYLKPCEVGLYQHYATIAKATNKNIVLYNNPGRTNCDISGQIVIKLANNHQNIVAIKDCSGQSERIHQINNALSNPNCFFYYSGDDGELISNFESGGAGSFAVTANIIPQAMQVLAKLCQQQQFTAAESLFNNLNSYHHTLLGLHTNPIAIKAAMAARGVINNILRSPLIAQDIDITMLNEVDLTPYISIVTANDVKLAANSILAEIES